MGWINRYLDREYVRRLANTSLYSYAHSLLHFVRWWEGVHHTGDISEADLTESTLLDYIRFQSCQQPPPSASTINDRVACADRAIRNEFPDAPCQAAPGFHQVYMHRRPLGLGRPRFDLSRLRIREPRLAIVPLSVDEVARFWSSFHTARDLAIVGLMLMHGLRSAEVIAPEPRWCVVIRSPAPRARQGQQDAPSAFGAGDHEAFLNRNRWFPECLAVSKGGTDMPAVPTLSETPNFEVYSVRSNSTDLAHRRPANWSRSNSSL